MVRDTTLRIVIGADFLRPRACANLRLARRGLLGGEPLALGLVDAGAQNLHCALAVLQLRALVLAGHHNAGRQVRNAHGRVGRVDGLTTRTGGTVDIDLEVLLLDRDLDLFGLGQDSDRRRRRVDASLRLGRRHALHAMHARLPLERRVGTVAGDFE